MEVVGKNNENINQFLKATEFCDYKNSQIQEIARAYSAKYTDRKTLAIKLFEFVRDEIKYEVGPWNILASETLERKKGMCTTSTNLLVALYRAVGIPAGYCIYTVVGGESFGHILPNIIRSHIHKHSVHIVCYTYLDQWIKCDPSTDSDLSSNSNHISSLTELVVWDGEHDAVHKIDPTKIINISGPLANIDYQFRKKPRAIVRRHIFHIGNYYIHFLRTEGKSITSKDEVDTKFKKWLKANQPISYYRYLAAYHFYNLIKKISKHA